MAFILSALPMVLKLILYVVDLFKKTPQEQRREALIDLDQAIEKAKKNNDLTELTKWFGRRV